MPSLWRQAADRAMALAQGDQIAGLSEYLQYVSLTDSPGNP